MVSGSTGGIRRYWRCQEILTVSGRTNVEIRNSIELTLLGDSRKFHLRERTTDVSVCK